MTIRDNESGEEGIRKSGGKKGERKERKKRDREGF